MSVNWLRVIPTVPDHVPSPQQQDAVIALLRELAPQAGEVVVVTADSVELVDAGSNFSTMRCPSCLVEIDLDWWQGEMSRWYDAGSSNLSAVPPCCGRTTTLNDLLYDWPQGFARWRAEVRSPARGRLGEAEVQALAAALGHDIREIWTHL